MVLAVTSCGSGFGSSCGEDHDAVKLARSLSQERLSRLYKDIYDLRETNAGVDQSIEYGMFGLPIPEKFQDLNAVSIRPSYLREPNIMLAGCMDEFIYLKFYRTQNGESKIELSWGPFQEKQILWPIGRIAK